VRDQVAIMWTVAGITALAGPSMAWRSYSAARGEAQTETQRLVVLQEKGATLARLRAASWRWSSLDPDEGSLAPRVTQALTAAGVPASSLASLTPQSQAMAGGLSKRSAAVSLVPITLPKLGAFLGAWRVAEPGWLVSSIEVSPDLEAAATPGADRPLRVSLTLESLAAAPGAAP